MARSPLLPRRHLSILPEIAPRSVRLAGELDISRIDEVRRGIAAALTEGPGDIELDLSGVTFMDCATVGALITCLHQVRLAGSRLRVCAASAAARRVLDLTGTGEALGLAPTA